MRPSLWFEHTIDNYLAAVAEGREWRAAIAEAEAKVQAEGTPRRVLTRGALKSEKGISYSRAQLHRMVLAGDFPKPFRLPTTAPSTAKKLPKKSFRRKRSTRKSAPAAATASPSPGTA
jgi:hypothetical protein